jgi:hypothetical protein
VLECPRTHCHPIQVFRAKFKFWSNFEKKHEGYIAASAQVYSADLRVEATALIIIATYTEI